MTSKITLKYFASISDALGVRQEIIETTCTTVEELFKEIKTKYKFNLKLQQVKFAINNKFCAPASHLKEGDIVYIMPPVSGG